MITACAWEANESATSVDYDGGTLWLRRSYQDICKVVSIVVDVAIQPGSFNTMLLKACCIGIMHWRCSSASAYRQ